MELSEITRSLQEIPRTLENVESIRELISKIGKRAYMKVTFHKGNSILRARVNKFGQKFSQDNELSFVPPNSNKTYQRASTPNQTMFYGCIQPNDNYPPARVTAMLESSNWLRQKDMTSIGKQKITYGKWEIDKDLHLLPVFLPQEILNTSYNNYLNDTYSKCLLEQQLSKEFIEESKLLMNFLGEEFRRKIQNEYDYLISALFTESVVNIEHIDGILYPSVQANFEGYNVALKPNAVDKLKLKAVGENMIYKKGEHLRLGNGNINTYAQDTQHLSSFEIQDYIEDSEAIKEICEDFNIYNINELPLI